MKTERKGVRIKQEDFDIYVKGQRLKARTLKHELNRKNTSPLLVFLHEALESITQWKDFPESLVNHSGLDALVYDRLGHGQSDPREKRRGVSYRHREALEYLPEVLKQSGVEEVILIGHSDGGTIA
ncbi:MAG: alpha/beta fold hydrolase, partial [Calditrichae bacterium]|nr:alpha/beta fold hydrolase [Calditrichia bacterium]NIV71871.1 alpha/beta fold hydrolase [Calditrichia bacterium]NIW78723.1 alpha/beta fold hydrolase [Calditrichia bacterium]